MSAVGARCPAALARFFSIPPGTSVPGVFNRSNPLTLFSILGFSPRRLRLSPHPATLSPSCLHLGPYTFHPQLLLRNSPYGVAFAVSLILRRRFGGPWSVRRAERWLPPQSRRSRKIPTNPSHAAGFPAMLQILHGLGILLLDGGLIILYIQSVLK
jgi:hypothetical protein